jgi:glycosyltransferase involved in cell wall biosynthesis
LLLNALSVAPTSLPLQAAVLWSQTLMKQIEKSIQTAPPDIIHVEHLRMARYGLRFVQGWPVIWDAVDYLSVLYEQAAITSSSRIQRWISRFEAPRLRRYERWLTGQFPFTIVISKKDCELFQKDNPYADRVQTALTGVPIELSMQRERSANTLIITGTLNYHPNVTSVLYFARDIFPLVQQRRSDVRLQLVGAYPVPSIAALKSASIEVTGFVPSITDYLQKATVALAPVVYGSGMQIKVLEAFLTATPLVATSVALRGLDVRDGEHVLVADTPDAFANAVLKLLDSPELRQKLGEAGRRYVEENHDLRKTTEDLVAIYQMLLQKSAHQRQ